MPMRTSSVAEPPTTADPTRGEPSSRTRSLSPVWFVLAMAPLAVAARFTLLWQWPIPQCWLRKLTGVPCPSCGCTRSLAAWTSLDFEQALRFNPLFFLLCLGLLLWCAVWIAEKILHRSFLAERRARLKHWPWWKLGAVLLALNWLYLCLTLPK